MRRLLIYFLFGITGTVAVFFLFIWTGTLNPLHSSPNAHEKSAALPLGKAIYEAKCTTCHGDDGKGDGRAAALLNPKPRDFTSGMYKIRTTESGSIPTDEDLARAITNGLHGSAMPDWGPFLSGDSLKAIVAYIKSFSPRFEQEKPRVAHISAPVPSSPPSTADGKRVYAKLQCASCHGTDGKGTGATATELFDDWGDDIVAANLTEPWTFKGGSTARDIYLRFRTGMNGTPMPSYLGSASEKEMWDLANYVVSLARKPVWAMDAEALKTFYAAADAEAKKNPVQRGKYLVEAQCVGCHSGYSADGKVLPEFKLAGGLVFDLYPFGKFTSFNLTSDKETGLGNWTDEEIKRAITQGIQRDGSRLLPFPMPWTSIAQMPDDDVNAIIAYLRTVPPIHNKVPMPGKPNFFSYMWGKFEMLILKKQTPGYIYPMKDFTKEAE
ncbi:MAG: c-type cytochrome [Bacteroidota bacterium]|nr:c-type cytochrome [Bacteroidota bacterium]